MVFVAAEACKGLVEVVVVVVVVVEWILWLWLLWLLLSVPELSGSCPRLRFWICGIA